ncbi:hypothetical protein ACSSS7_004906 [Eimeria intestinalis]
MSADSSYLGVEARTQASSAFCILHSVGFAGEQLQLTSAVVTAAGGAGVSVFIAVSSFRTFCSFTPLLPWHLFALAQQPTAFSWVVEVIGGASEGWVAALVVVGGRLQGDKSPP